MVWLPGARADVVKVAIPPLSVPVPIGLPPSKKVTVPVGVPDPGATGETVAVKVTDCPKTGRLNDEVTVVVVLALLTVRDAVLLLVECTASAGYVAAMVCGLAATLAGVTFDVQVEAVLVLGVSVHAPVMLSVGSDELTPTVPRGLKEGA